MRLNIMKLDLMKLNLMRLIKSYESISNDDYCIENIRN